jgi:hypothetical protein
MHQVPTWPLLSPGTGDRTRVAICEIGNRMGQLDEDLCSGVL